MTMAMDSRPAHQLGGMGYDPLRHYQNQFGNPWGTGSNSPHQIYQGLPQQSSAIDNQSQRAPIMSMGYVANPAASSLVAPSFTLVSAYVIAIIEAQPVLRTTFKNLPQSHNHTYQGPRNIYLPKQSK